MSEAPPILFAWDGEHMTPASPHWARTADKHFVIGERYSLEEHLDRSSASHRHYFAAVNDAWQNLPDALAAEYPNAEKLRKHALIKAGYADSQTFVCTSRAEAFRLQQFLRPIDEFSIITTEGATVTRYTAKSQSQRAMGKEAFEKSKFAVLEILAQMIGTTPDELARNAA